MRRPHIIQKNHKTTSPNEVIFFDTETRERKDGDEIILELVLGHAVYKNYERGKREAFSFVTKKEFWGFVDSKAREKRRLYLVAHNIGFDMRVVSGFKELCDRGWRVENMYFNATTNIWIFKNGKRSILMLDNMNFFKSSLAYLGKSIGIEKTEMPTRSKKKLMEYCKNDVEIMIRAWDMLMAFIDENDLGNFSKTIASQAFSTYRHRFMKSPIHIHTNKKVIEIERESYYGGRTECFYIGQLPKQNYWLLDVNSMYPSVMIKNEYPHKLERVVHNVTKKEMIEYIKKYAVVAKCDIRTDIPAYPYRSERLLFPVGSFNTALTTREIEYSLKKGHFKGASIAVLFEKDMLFRDYVDFFYKKRLVYREQGNESFAFVCKLMLNSLYGKFGQRNDEYKKVEGIDIPSGYFEYYDLDKGEKIQLRNIGGLVEKKVGLREARNSFVSIASHITADARMVLWNFIETAEIENCFYCDTDSILVNREGYKRLKKYISNTLGDLSEQEKVSHVILRGAKDYTMGDTEKTKGIRSDAIQIDENTFEQVQFEGLAGALRKGRLNEMRLKNVIKNLKREYKKGRVNNNGRVEPIIL